MRKLVRRALSGAAVAVTVLSLAAPTMSAAPAGEKVAGSNALRSDNHKGPLSDRQEARRKAAQRLILSGKASPDEDGVVALGGDKYYQAAVTGTGQVFTILSEFGSDAKGKYGTVAGPVHNEIPQPDREFDNSTHWNSDFNQAYYEDLFFGDGESFKDFYWNLSNGNYTVGGGVSDWVQVPGNASLYGDNAIEDFGGAWQFIEDTGNAWYDQMVADGMSDADIKDYLSQFDVWDRYDYDNDSDFNESDGYIDHFQAVHAGEGEDAGGGAQGADAIWSHRWYVNQTDFGVTGPTVGSEDVLFGGSQIGDTGYWIGDYTVEAENGGLGVFAHEFGHDLGLPDFYDTNGGENSTAFWTLMSSGSWLNHGTDDIGTTPNYYGPWEKLQLGWLDYSVVSTGEGGQYTLSPAALQVEGQDQAVIVDVPDEAVETEYVAPNGGHAWWTSSADDLNTTLTRTLNLGGVKSAVVSAKAWFNIEDGYDYLHAEYSLNGGETWTELGSPITGDSKGHWTTVKYTVPGGDASTEFRYRFQSDSGVHLDNAFLDDFVVKSGGTTLFSDDVESGDNGWVAEGGFKVSTGTESVIGDRYYIVENRTHTGYDETLGTGPYQFSFALTAPNKVERFSFPEGLLVWMVDETYTDNNTIDHVGHGLALPVDARPTPFTFPDGTKPSNRRQPYDATFGLAAMPSLTLHKEVYVGKGKAKHVELVDATAPGDEGIATFDDSDVDGYWSADNALNSTYVAGWGVNVEVTAQHAGGTMTIEVTNPAE